MMAFVKKYLPHFAVFLFASAVYLFGWLDAPERFLSDQRFNVIERDATGSVVIVEIDSRSLQEIDTWPWPRVFHAALINMLNSLGAREIAYDVDFSSHSTVEDDQALAQSLAWAKNRVILPVFKQKASSQSTENDIIDTLPLPAFREQARLGAVNIHPDADGLVRSLNSSELINGAEIPSLPNMMAIPDGLVPGHFGIDFGIRSASIPRYSFIDVLAGDFPMEAIDGKSVIVGGTALELGGRFSTPTNPAMAGPVLMAMGYESLVQGRTFMRVNSFPVLAIAFSLALLAGPYFFAHSWQRGALALGGGVVAILGLSFLVQAVFPIQVDMAPWLLVLFLGYASSMAQNVESLTVQIYREQMANAHHTAMVKNMVEDSFDGIVITDWRGRIQVFNPAAEKILGHKTKAVIGHSVTEILPDVSRRLNFMVGNDEEAEASRFAYMSEPIEAVIPREGRAPQIIEMFVSESVARRKSSPQGNDDPQRRIHIFTFRDVTMQRRRQDHRDQVAEKAIADDHARVKFLGNMSHELRTPLNVIIGFSEIIKNGLMGEITPHRYKAYASDIHESSLHLLNLINDILDLEKVEDGQIEVHDDLVDISDVFRVCLQGVRPQSNKKGITLVSSVIAPMPKIRGDRQMMMEIFINLINNAINYTERGGHISVKAYLDSSARPTFEVADTGIGIDKEDISKVTESFYRGKSAESLKVEGTGLGLALVNGYVKTHNGEIEIKSEKDVGTVVRIRFPSHRLVMSDGTFEKTA